MMKINRIYSIITTLLIMANMQKLALADTFDGQINDSQTKSRVTINSVSPNKLSDTCNIESVYEDGLAVQSRAVKIDNTLPASLSYLNDEVKDHYDIMRDKVINHVKKEVVLSLFKMNEDGFAPENIASYVSKATRPFLPFSFANGVKIVDITHKYGTIVYKAVTPIHKNHDHTVLLTKAGIASARNTVCNDSTMVEDLLERDIVIQYDYYDSEGIFICSFNIKESHS